MSDVCLILEGTFPYVTGGVSTCVYQLIKETPHLKYSILYIGASGEVKQSYKYPIPENVRLIREIFLYDYEIKGDLKNIGDIFNADLFQEFHKLAVKGDVSLFDQIYQTYFNPNKRSCDPMDILESTQAWEFVTQFYRERFKEGSGPSFIDYFYNWRFTHFPLFKVLTTEIPRANVYHSLCTGYAGLIGATAKILYGRPFILTEHGIYSHEREIEIYQADWIHNTQKDLIARSKKSVFKDWWIKIFHFMSKVAYRHADIITTLHEGNKEKQIRYGADEEKIEIIPNGINVEQFSQLPREQSSEIFEIALIGRVVPIKDIKTFIKSVNHVYEQVPNLKVYIIGPYDEDEDYYFDCVRLVQLLNLGDVIEFTGKVDVKKFLPKIHLIVLSSISEGQPMVILEAYAAGVPVVTTDVGSCRELVYGGSFADRELGISGDVVPFGMADTLGDAIIRILKDKELHKKMSDVAYQRVHHYYREDQTINNYLNVYNRFLSKSF